jgi:hypothetical protein
MGKRKTLEAQVKLLRARLAECQGREQSIVKTRERVLVDMAEAMREVAEATTISLTHGFCGLEETCYTLIAGISPWGLLAEAALRGMTEGVPEETAHAVFRHGARWTPDYREAQPPDCHAAGSFERSCWEAFGNPG